MVEVYKNGALLATRDITSWPYYAGSGYIGLWTIGASSGLLDDFGGGTRPLAYQNDGQQVAMVSSHTVHGGRKGLELVKSAPRALNHPPAGQVWRSYYYAGGVRVAMRVTTSTTSDVYYLLTDQLGSTNITVDASGNKVGELRYKPWGETRYTWGSTPTDRQYTGQINESDLGLYFYNARWYDSSLGRFIQPDSLIPQPGNPQAWDRFSYVQNNPINFNDPSGNKPCDGADLSVCTPYDNSIEGTARQYRIKFTGSNWNTSDQLAVLDAIELIGTAFANQTAIADSSSGAFRAVYGHTVTFEHVTYECAEGCWGRSLGSSSVRFYEPSTGHLDSRLVVHELGHSFDSRTNELIGSRNGPTRTLDKTRVDNITFPRREDKINGFAGNLYGWQQSSDLTPGEEFADMFIGWAYNRWQDSPAGVTRSDWMNSHMPVWVQADYGR